MAADFFADSNSDRNCFSIDNWSYQLGLNLKNYKKGKTEG
jgi:hypothetical protein